MLFRVKVAVTPELISWILHYGEQVEVLEPDLLRKKEADAHSRAAALYADIRSQIADSR